jgi:hypothetical protein
MLHEKYKKHIIGFPTLLLFNAQGEVIHRMAGYKKAEDLIDGMQAALEGKSFYVLEKKYGEGARDFETVAAYAGVLKNALLTQRLDSVLNEYLETMPLRDLLDAGVWKVVGSAVKNPYSKSYQFVVDSLDRISRKLDVDRYELEQQLGRGMSQAVNEIIKVSATSVNPDSVRWVKNSTGSLMTVLLKNNIKNFPDCAAKLHINTLRLQDKPEEIFEMLKYITPLGIPADKSFVAETYRYVINRTTDRNIIQSSLDEVLACQSKYKDLFLLGNFYDIIAAAYAKLGDQAKAQEAKAEYEKRKKEKDAYFNGLMKKKSK